MTGDPLLDSLWQYWSLTRGEGLMRYEILESLLLLLLLSRVSRVQLCLTP